MCDVALASIYLTYILEVMYKQSLIKSSFKRIFQLYFAFTAFITAINFPSYAFQWEYKKTEFEIKI